MREASLVSRRKRLRIREVRRGGPALERKMWTRWSLVEDLAILRSL